MTVPLAKPLTADQVAQGRAACTAYLGLVDALKRIYPGSCAWWTTWTSTRRCLSG